MKSFFLCCFLLLTIFIASSQKVYFVYLQTEADQPFFVKQNEKFYSSTSSGYLILSKLKDSVYNFSIGFPQNKWPEQSFSIAINRKDHGYLLKNFGENGWGLFDLQTLAVQMAKMKQTGVEQKTSAFTEILARSADDPTLKEKQVQPKIEEKKIETIPGAIAKTEEPKKEEKKVEIIPETVAKKDQIEQDQAVQSAIKKEEDVKADIKEEPIKKSEEIKPIIAESYQRSIVTKKSESSNVDGFGLMFIDKYETGTIDTIRLVIPNPKSVVTEMKQEPKEEKKFLDIMPDTSAKMITEQGKENISGVKPTAIIANHCKEAASEDDFYKLRKKMAAVTNDEDMIVEARKYFKGKCFTTAQLKNLSTLFLNDSGKYKFFDEAYLYTSDVENFSALQSELKDDYYINRFKAMLK